MSARPLLLIATPLIIAASIGCQPKPPTGSTAPTVATVAGSDAPEKAWAKIGEPVTAGDLKVTLTDVRLGKMNLQKEVAGPAIDSGRTNLWAFLSVENLSPAKLRRYESWSEIRPSVPAWTVFTDEHANKYRVEGAGKEWKPEGVVMDSTIRPGKVTLDAIPFEVPVENANRFRLELKHPDQDLSPFRFEFTRDQIKATSPKK